MGPQIQHLQTPEHHSRPHQQKTKTPSLSDNALPSLTNRKQKPSTSNAQTQSYTKPEVQTEGCKGKSKACP